MSFKLVQRREARLVELADPALVDFLKWHGIQKMQFLASPPAGRNEIGRFDHRQMLCHGLARHVEVLAKFAEGLSIMRIKQVQQFAPARIGERFEKQVRVIHSSFLMCWNNTQVNTCMSNPALFAEQKPPGNLRQIITFDMITHVNI
jgi:hypothetical protein